MRYKTWILMTLQLALVTPALAQENVESDPDAAAQARITASLDVAAEAGIPLELLESKINEGQAKGVPMARIAAAVEARRAGLERAHEALAAGNVDAVTAGELSVAADALEAGVSESALVTMHTSAPSERRLVAVAVLSALVELGNASDVALTRVQAALSNGSAALADLRARTALELRGRRGGGHMDLSHVSRIEALLGHR